ncbi:MAG: ketopantoate reductase family protein [Polyangiaceae bacterium]|nr:ketopantoate reductase family protein [Polyangiaceae bacterium]
MSARVLVVGCGGLGGIVAAHLTEQREALGVEVVASTTNREIARAVNERGFVLRGASPRTVRGSVASSLPEGTRPFDWIVLAVQPPQVEEAARAAAHLLAPSGAMVCLQNGLCEDRVAAIVGADRVVGAVVSWGGAMPEPGVYDRTAEGGFTLGVMSGADDARLSALATLLEPVGPVTLTRNLAGARWSTLAINCAISTLGTLWGGTLGSAMVHRAVRRLALEIMTETVDVARREGVALEKVAGTIDLDWIALTDAERRAVGSPSLLAKHSLLLAVGARYRRMRSSMLAAIERGRTPAVDFLNGEVTTRARRFELATPVNAAAARLVHEVAARRAEPGEPLIRRLAAETAT